MRVSENPYFRILYALFVPFLVPLLTFKDNIPVLSFQQLSIQMQILWTFSIGRKSEAEVFLLEEK